MRMKWSPDGYSKNVYLVLRFYKGDCRVLAAYNCKYLADYHRNLLKKEASSLKVDTLQYASIKIKVQ